MRDYLEKVIVFKVLCDIRKLIMPLVKVCNRNFMSVTLTIRFGVFQKFLFLTGCLKLYHIFFSTECLALCNRRKILQIMNINEAITNSAI